MWRANDIPWSVLVCAYIRSCAVSIPGSTNPIAFAPRRTSCIYAMVSAALRLLLLSNQDPRSRPLKFETVPVQNLNEICAD